MNPEQLGGLRFVAIRPAQRIDERLALRLPERNRRARAASGWERKFGHLNLPRQMAG